MENPNTPLPDRIARAVAEYHAELYRFAALRTGSRSDAEDIVQEAFLRLLTAPGEITHLRAYLYRCVANACCDRKRRHAVFEPLGPQLPADDGEAPLREEAERIAALLDRLPEEQAEVIRLPEGITWTDYTRPMQAGRLAGIDAVQAGRMILEAFATWNEAILDEALYSYGAGARELLKKRYAGARVTELGKPFRSGKYAGVFIPCTLRMADGSTEKIRLALRNDNSEQRWLVDGGL